MNKFDDDEEAIYWHCFERLAEAAGGTVSLARTLRLSRTGVTKWRRHGIPYQRIPELVVLYRIPKHELNPIIYKDPRIELQQYKALGISLHKSSPRAAA